MMRDKLHDAMAEEFRDDPVYAAELLNAVLADGDQAEVMITLRQLAKAFGGVPAVADAAHLNPTQIYRMLSPEGNPAFSSLTAVLRAMGLRLSVAPIDKDAMAH